MNKIVTVLAGLSVLTLATISCQKEEHDQKITRTETPQTIAATVPSGQTYKLSLGAGSTANITKQASHYLISDVSTESGGNTVYTYSAAKGYAGADEVTLEQTTTSVSSGGGCGNHDGGLTTTTRKTVVIKFDVTN